LFLLQPRTQAYGSLRHMRTIGPRPCCWSGRHICTSWQNMATGRPAETLKEYPHHCAMLSFRSRDGEAEVHENFADVFYVLDGRATLVTGGTVGGVRQVGPGETRGSSVEGGVRQELRAGDVAHVPAGLPHQMLVAGDKTVTCLVLKVEENQ
jgi:mannose-6-phosphate isomerase-like protein (cupin superfamily)